jgi:acyl-CoA reductase-like NAD-dependent aldehyde dehydrogenase
VCSDADLNLAAKHIVKGGFSYSGQRCTAVKVVLVDNQVCGAGSDGEGEATRVEGHRTMMAKRRTAW